VDTLTDEQIKTLDHAALEVELSNRVYEASLLIERLENAGRVFGNGHHAAQKIAEFASNDLKSRWKSG
jgi:hypothetical protein